MKVLITGASGNLGRHLVEALPHDTLTFHRNGRSLDDLLAEQVDVVVHAAGDITTCVKQNPEAVAESNVMLTARLLSRLVQHGVPRLIYISSCAVYGDALDTREDISRRPTSINGISKLLCEKMIEEVCAENGIKFELLRLFNLYGGSDRFSIFAHIKRAILQGTAFTLNNQGRAFRDFIHVGDASRLIGELIDMDIPYSSVNVGTGTATRISDIVDRVRHEFPEIPIRETFSEEVEYSRANIDRLSSLLNPRFTSVLEYTERDFLPECFAAMQAQSAASRWRESDR